MYADSDLYFFLWLAVNVDISPTAGAIDNGAAFAADDDAALLDALGPFASAASNIAEPLLFALLVSVFTAVIVFALALAFAFAFAGGGAGKASMGAAGLTGAGKTGGAGKASMGGAGRAFGAGLSLGNGNMADSWSYLKLAGQHIDLSCASVGLDHGI